jgi:hypothetical protein
MVLTITLATTTALFLALWIVTRGKLVESRSMAVLIAKRSLRALNRRGVPRGRAIRLVCPELAQIFEENRK